MPPASLIVLILSGLILIRKRKRLGKALILTGLLFLYLLSLDTVSDMLLRPLERAAAPLKTAEIIADAVVVPGGGSVDLEWIGAGPVPNAETYTRLIKGIELSRELRIPLVLTGGNGEPFATRVKDADAMAEAAYSLVIPQHQVIVENLSRNTLENSYAVRKLISGDRIILATSAYYMKRASAMFSKRGFTVVPAPTYYLSQTRKRNFSSLIPKADNLRNSTTALAEWISLAWWWIRGEV